MEKEEISMRKLHRAVALLLTLMMVLSVLPLGAAAYVGPDVAVPEGQELVYFADCGATSFTSDIEALIAQYPDSVVNKTTPDQAYDASSTTPWGYTNPKGEIETNYPDSGDIYKSVRNFRSKQNGKTLSYKFTVPAGTYQVAVGLYDPWSSSNPLTRVAEVQVNQSASQEFRYSGSNAGMLTFKNIALAEAGTIDVNVAPDDPNANEDNRDALVSFIMVTRTVEQPEPEQPALPGENTSVWSPVGGNNYNIAVTYTCENDQAIHQAGKTVKKNLIYGKFFDFGNPTLVDGTWTVSASLKVGAYLTDLFKEPHTSEQTVSLTLEYNSENEKWYLPVTNDEDGTTELNLSGTCTSAGPEAPSTKNCSNFYVTVYGEVPQLDGSVDNKSVSSSRWDIAMNHDVEITFSTPAFVDGVWTCNATVDAAAYIEEAIDSTTDRYRLDDTSTKTITLTYNTSTGKWLAGSDGVDYATGGSKYGVAFKLQRQFTVTYGTERDLAGAFPSGTPTDGGAFDAGATVTLPQETSYTTENGVFAGWKLNYGPKTDRHSQFYPLGGTEMAMPAYNAEVNAYWMDVELDVASEAYDASKAVGDYTFGEAASFADQKDPVTVLYRAQVQGNSQYPYALTCEDAEAVYDSTLSGTIDQYASSKYVYFTKTYTPGDEVSSETVRMGNASDSAAVSITWNTEPDMPNQENAFFHVTVYSEEAQLDGSAAKNKEINSVWWGGYPDLVDVEFTKPVQGSGGVWTCQATINAEAYVAKTIEDSTNTPYRRSDDPTTKTITLTYNEATEKWIVPSDGVDYATGGSKNGVAFKLVKQFKVTFAPGRDLDYGIPSGEKYSGGVYDAGATVELPETTNFVPTKGEFAGWCTTIKYSYLDSERFFYPIGTDMEEMFAIDVTLEAYWMDVELEVASQAYDESMAVKDYTFGDTATFSDIEDSVTVLYRASVWGNTGYPYELTCQDATPVYNTTLSGTMPFVGGTPRTYVYFTKTYTPDDAVSSETVLMGNASDSAAVSITWKESHTHTYGEPQWTWAEDNSTATATFTCSSCDDVQTVTTTATSSTTAPTCTEAGETVYSATVTFNGTEYTGTKTVTLPATGHDYGEPQWTWNTDNNTATAKFTCSACGDVQTETATVTSTTTEPTCTTDGQTIYTATVTFSGESYTDTKTVPLSAIGHKYGEPQWAWAADNSTATAKFTCSACGDVQTVTATVNSETTQPTCTADGKTVYTATVSFGGKNHTDTKTVTIPATGHDYGAPQWSWHKDYTAYAVFTCANDKTHQETCKASVTRSVQKATCTRPETTTYTATVVFNGTRYQDKLVVEGYALGHRWNDGEVTTRPTASKPGERTYTCLRCGAVKYETIPATGETVVDYFWDVSAHDWFADEVTYVVEAGLMEGVGNHLFDPNGEVTRAMTWTVLARMDGEDVDGGTPWYAKARTWAMDDGVSDGTNPNNAVTREQLVTMLYRYAGSPRVYGTLTGYTDCDKVSDWAVDAMIWATDTGLIQGMGGKLNPQGTATRAQLATMLMRFVEIMK